MASDEAGCRRPRRTEPPLYDARFEHDACGVGFVADAGGSAHDQVLPLALKGLGALGHRGAFGADGASSDGAGILLPLEPSVVELVTGGERIARGAARPGLCSLFLPRRVSEARLARDGVRAALEAEGLGAWAWRPVPFEPGVLGPQAAAARPIVEQVLVPRPRGMGGAAFERALVLARRRMEQTARSNGLDGFAVASASARTVVYKGLVVGARLAELYPDLAAPLAVSHAVFHQRYATNTMPTWPLAQPFRLLAHNGEINTVRGNREQVRGRAADAARSDAARRLQAAGPLLSPGVSDSASLDEAIELLVQTGWTLEAALRALMPDVPACDVVRAVTAIRTQMRVAIPSHHGTVRRPSSSATAVASAASSIATASDRWPTPSPIGGWSSRPPRQVPSTCPPRAPSDVGASAQARCSSSSLPPD